MCYLLVESNGGKFDPPLLTVQAGEEEATSGKLPERVSSADPAKAKRRFPWTKKEVSKSTQLNLSTCHRIIFVRFIANHFSLHTLHLKKNKSVK